MESDDFFFPLHDKNKMTRFNRGITSSRGKRQVDREVKLTPVAIPVLGHPVRLTSASALRL